MLNQQRFEGEKYLTGMREGGEDKRLGIRTAADLEKIQKEFQNTKVLQGEQRASIERVASRQSIMEGLRSANPSVRLQAARLAQADPEWAAQMQIDPQYLNKLGTLSEAFEKANINLIEAETENNKAKSSQLRLQTDAAAKWKRGEKLSPVEEIFLGARTPAPSMNAFESLKFEQLVKGLNDPKNGTVFAEMLFTSMAGGDTKTFLLNKFAATNGWNYEEAYKKLTAAGADDLNELTRLFGYMASNPMGFAGLDPTSQKLMGAFMSTTIMKIAKRAGIEINVPVAPLDKFREDFKAVILDELKKARND